MWALKLNREGCPLEYRNLVRFGLFCDVAEVDICRIQLVIDLGESIRNLNELPLELRFFFCGFIDEEIGNSLSNEVEGGHELVVFIDVLVIVLEGYELFLVSALWNLSKQSLNVLIRSSYDFTR